MLKRVKKIRYEGSSDDLITMHPVIDLPKKSTIEIPQGYHVVLLGHDGTAELIKNQYKLVLESPVMYVYYIKSHQGLHTSNWGTRSRVQVKTSTNEIMTLGGYGNVEWKISNPIQLITSRLENHKALSVQSVAKIVLDKLPTIFQEIMHDESIINPSEISKLIDKTRPKLKKVLSEYLFESGIEVNDCVIENINLLINEEQEAQ